MAAAARSAVPARIRRGAAAAACARPSPGRPGARRSADAVVLRCEGMGPDGAVLAGVLLLRDRTGAAAPRGEAERAGDPRRRDCDRAGRVELDVLPVEVGRAYDVVDLPDQRFMAKQTMARHFASLEQPLLLDRR